jgi:hypothetical protein
VFTLRQSLAAYRYFQRSIAECDIEVEKLLCQFDARIDVEVSPLPPPKVRRKKLYSNEPSFDLRQHLYRIFGVDLTAVPGINVLIAHCALAEVGPDQVPQRIGFRLVAWTLPRQRHQRWENSVGADPKGRQPCTVGISNGGERAV